MITISGVDELKPIVLVELRTWHRGQANRAEKWALVEKVCGVSIPVTKRTNNNLYDRKVRLAISELRKEGALICSDTDGGYWWAASIEDVLSVSESLRGRAKDLLRTARQMRVEALREFGGQQRLF